MWWKAALTLYAAHQPQSPSPLTTFGSSLRGATSTAALRSAMTPRGCTDVTQGNKLILRPGSPRPQADSQGPRLSPRRLLEHPPQAQMAMRPGLFDWQGGSQKSRFTSAKLSVWFGRSLGSVRAKSRFISHPREADPGRWHGAPPLVEISFPLVTKRVSPCEGFDFPGAVKEGTENGELRARGGGSCS